MQEDLSDSTTIGADGLKMRFSSAPLGVRCAVKRVEDWLQNCGVAESDRGSAEIVLAEALNNISEHSYAEDAGGDVELTAIIQARELMIMIVDQGRAMPVNVFPNIHKPASCPEPEALAEGGFGWFLIQQLTEEMSYQRDGTTNRLRLSLKIGE